MLGFKSGLAELVQPGTTSASQAEGRGFKSRTPHLILTKNDMLSIITIILNFISKKPRKDRYSILS